jgi:hypothetical protein
MVWKVDFCLLEKIGRQKRGRGGGLNLLREWGTVDPSSHVLDVRLHHLLCTLQPVTNSVQET